MGLQPNKIYQRMLCKADADRDKYAKINERAQSYCLPMPKVYEIFWQQGYPMKAAKKWLREFEEMDKGTVGWIEGQEVFIFTDGGYY